MREATKALCRITRPFLVRYFFILSAVIPLTLFFTGKMDRVGEVKGLGRIVPPGQSVFLDTAEIPRWWTRFDLLLYLEGKDAGAHLRAALGTGKRGVKPLHSEPGRVLFRLQTPPGSLSGLTLHNLSGKPVILSRYTLRNFSAINTGFPRSAVLLTPYKVPSFPVPTMVLLVLLGAAWPLPGLILLQKGGVGRPNRGPLGLLLWTPWVVLSLALILWVMKGWHLLLTGEAWLLIFVPGYLLLFFQGRFFRARLRVPALLVLIVLTMTVLVATVLGFGIPVKKFGPALVYQRHIAVTARLAGLVYLLLIVGLYRLKREWFSPKAHLALSSLFLVFFPALILYLANGFADYVGDTTFNSQLAWNLLRGKGLFYTKEYVAAHGNFGLLEMGDKYLPKYPMGPGFLGLPTALLQYLFSQEEANRLISWNQKMTAVWVAALSAALMFQILYRVSRNQRLSLFLTAGFALGTTQLTISAATLWQHGPAVLLLCLGLLCLVKGEGENPKFLPLAAAPMAFLPMMRPQAVLFYLAALAAVSFLRPKMIPRFILFSLPGLALTFWINWGLYHSFLGGSSYQVDKGNFPVPILQGALGLLFSPNRGLFIFSPFLIFGVIGAAILWSERSVSALSFGAAGLLFFLIHAKWVVWHGGYCVAPRFTSELVPLLVFFSIPFWLRAGSGLARWGKTILLLLSLAVHLPGFFYLFENEQWNVFPDVDRYQQERVWDYRDWLPIHFRHFWGLTRFHQVPAYAFVVTGLPGHPGSKEHHYRVEVELDQRPVEIIKVTNIPLKKGSYKILFRGDARKVEGAKADWVVGFVGRKVEEKSVPLSTESPLFLVHPIEMDRSGHVDVRLFLSGRGVLVVDTVQLLPAEKLP